MGETVLVTGGTGHLGRDIVRLLKADGQRVRVLARSPGTDPDIEWVKGDLGTGEGIAEAVNGVTRVVHAATHSPAARRGMVRLRDLVTSPTDVDVTGTRQLLAAAAKSRVDHFLHISIVGVQQSRLPYSKVKAAAEDEVRGGAVPWSIVPATAFYWLLARMFDTVAHRRLWPLPANAETQPCDSADFAEYAVTCLLDGPGGTRPDFGGPQIASFGEFAREYRAVRGIDRRVMLPRVPARMLRGFGRLTCGENGRRGTTTWSDWLKASQRERPSR